jgi:hypothetical protein
MDESSASQKSNGKKLSGEGKDIPTQYLIEGSALENRMQLLHLTLYLLVFPFYLYLYHTVQTAIF